MNPRRLLEPFRAKMVEPLPLPSRSEREGFLKKAGYNPFLLDSAEVTFDLLTDSGTAAMSAEQWGSMIVADEAYSGSRSFRKFEATVRALTGMSHVVPAHQGRAAEKILCSALLAPGKLVISNGLFETTRASLESVGAEGRDIPAAVAKDYSAPHPFKGDIDLAVLEKLCESERARIGFILLTVTNNSAGGQPVSLANLRAAAALARKHGLPLLLDACRFAENAGLIKMREKPESHRTVREIATEVFALSDGCFMSGKKDGLSNIGGFLAFRRDEWLSPFQERCVLFEGYPTYGGLAARDLEALNIGLTEVLDWNYLEYRLGLVSNFTELLNQRGVPTLQPAGGHAVYLDVTKALPERPALDFPALAVACELYLAESIRSLELGTAMTGRFEGGALLSAPRELIRLCLPRRSYLASHYEYMAEGIAEVMSRARELPSYRAVEHPEKFRILGAKFEPKA